MQWQFGPFRLDLDNACLWRGEQRVPLRPKPFDILVYLVEHTGELVTKEALLDAVWPDTAVAEGVLATSMVELRKALEDTAREPQFIATVHRRGYRFLAPVTVQEQPLPESEGLSSFSLPADASRSEVQTSAGLPPLMVSRETEMAQLHRHFTQGLQGERQVVFITGEAGIGKTTLVDAFVARIASTEVVWIGRGQCIEQYGVGEPYLPLLEALGRLARTLEGARLVELLHQQAPSWLVQMPALVPPEAYDTLQRRGGGATRERMLRELAEIVEVLTVERPLVLVLEDLHWSDASTLDWLAYVARRRDRARLLVLGTYRPLEAIVHAHPVHAVVQESQRHGQCAELLLDYLPEPGVAAYLAQRFGEGALPEGLARVLHHRTNGNPLFLVTVVDDVVRRGVVWEGSEGWELSREIEAVAVEVPESLRYLIEQQLEQVHPEEHEILEVASIAGREFAAVVVAAGLECAVEDIEARCDALARQGQFVVPWGMDTWPDGTVAARYRFIHDLYHETIYTRIPAGRRARWHRQIGARLEAGYGARARERSVELAEHFVRGHNTARAVKYLHYAGEQARQRSAHQEALQHLTQGLTLLATLPETPARVQQELDLQLALGPALMATKGAGAPEVEQTYARARALCAQVGETPQLLPTLLGLCWFYLSRGTLPMAREFGEQLGRLAQHAVTPTDLLEAHKALGITLFFLGEYAAAQTHCEQGITLINPTMQRTQALYLGPAPGVGFLGVAAHALWCLGYPAQAVQRAQEALDLAQVLAHPYSLAFAQQWAAVLHHRHREVSAVQVQAEALLALATAQGFPFYVALGTFWRGWTLAMQGQGETGLAQMHQGLEAVVAIGQELARPFCLVPLAEAMGHIGQVEAGLHLLTEALAELEASGQGYLLAEAYRLQGAFLLHQADVVRAEACFQQALAIARLQQAKSLELRAATSLSKLWQQQGKRDAARQLLAEVYGWFTEGFDTADLQEAKTMLEALGA